MTEPKITFDVKTQFDLILKQNKELQSQLKYERKLRTEAEQKVIKLEEALSERNEKPARKRRTKAEVEAERERNNGEYSEYKKDGKRKAHKTESIRSYSEFKAIQDYFLARDQVRDYMMWTIGVCFGLRISDLCRLKWKNVMNEDLTFRDRIKLYEKKTSKLQNCLITEAIKEAFVTYLNSVSWQIFPDDYILKSSQSSEAITEVQGWRVLNKAKEAVGIEYPFGSHSMRNSFANIVLCVDKSTIDMNAITKIQGLLNHSDPRTTMHYLGTLSEMYDKARQAVSEFALGRTEVNELIAGTQCGIEDVMNKLDEIKASIEK